MRRVFRRGGIASLGVRLCLSQFESVHTATGGSDSMTMECVRLAASCSRTRVQMLRERHSLSRRRRCFHRYVLPVVAKPHAAFQFPGERDLVGGVFCEAFGVFLLGVWRLSLVGFSISLIIETSPNTLTRVFGCSFLFAWHVRELMAFLAHSTLILREAVCRS